MSHPTCPLSRSPTVTVALIPPALRNRTHPTSPAPWRSEAKRHWAMAGIVAVSSVGVSVWVVSLGVRIVEELPSQVVQESDALGAYGEASP